MEQKDLLRVLHGDIAHIQAIDPFDENMSKEKVIIYPKDVRHILLEYLTDKISMEDLNEWAKFISLRVDCVPPGDPYDDQLSDYYDDMCDVINFLSTPEIDGAISKNRVKEYLAKLLKYEDE